MKFSIYGLGETLTYSYLLCISIICLVFSAAFLLHVMAAEKFYFKISRLNFSFFFFPKYQVISCQHK